jgi:FkbM family methyltransferase
MIRSGKRVLETLLLKAGLVLLSSWRWKTLPLASHTRDLLTQIGCDCVLDVGANKGQYVKFLRKHVGYDGPIFSFEPVQSLAEILLDKSKTDPLWTVFPFALGASPAERTIHIMAADTLNSFLLPLPPGLAPMGDINVKVRSEIVSVRTVDEILETPEMKRFSSIFLKMDTQGFDGEVLKGASISFSRIGALQSEISCIPIYEDNTDWLTSLKNLHELGFSVTGMFPVNRTKDLQVIEFDCLAINRTFQSPEPSSPFTGTKMAWE